MTCDSGIPCPLRTLLRLFASPSRSEGEGSLRTTLDPGLRRDDVGARDGVCLAGCLSGWRAHFRPDSPSPGPPLNLPLEGGGGWLKGEERWLYFRRWVPGCAGKACVWRDWRGIRASPAEPLCISPWKGEEKCVRPLTLREGEGVACFVDSGFRVRGNDVGARGLRMIAGRLEGWRAPFPPRFTLTLALSHRGRGCKWLYFRRWVDVTFVEVLVFAGMSCGLAGRLLGWRAPFPPRSPSP